jgi:hypothetical protein
MATASKPRTPRKPAPVALQAVTAPPEPNTEREIPTKAHQLITLLRRDGGASIAELATTLSWLPHTTRAALTGVRKKGHAIAKSKEGDVTRYRLVSTEAAS